MTKTSIFIRNLILAALLVAVNLLLPQAFHVFGPQAGRLFLPMHLGVLIAGLFLGPVYGMAVGAVSPVLSFLTTGMPQFPAVLFMTGELLTYGLISGLMVKALHKLPGKLLRLYVSLIAAMVAGRAVSVILTVAFGSLLGMKAAMTAPLAVIASLATGIPGAVLQLAVVPVLVVALEKLSAFAQRRIYVGEE